MIQCMIVYFYEYSLTVLVPVHHYVRSDGTVLVLCTLLLVARSTSRAGLFGVHPRAFFVPKTLLLGSSIWVGVGFGASTPRGSLIHLYTRAALFGLAASVDRADHASSSSSCAPPSSTERVTFVVRSLQRSRQPPTGAECHWI